MMLPAQLQERLDLEAGCERGFGAWLVGELDRGRAGAEVAEVRTNAIDFVPCRSSGMVGIADPLGVFAEHAVPHADFRDYLLARYP